LEPSNPLQWVTIDNGNIDERRYIDPEPDLYVPTAHAKPIYAFFELSDGTLMTASTDKTLKRWTRGGDLLRVFEGHHEAVFAAFETDAGTVISGFKDFTLREWDVATGECLYTSEKLSGSLKGLLKLKNGLLACGFEGGHIELRRSRTGSNTKNQIGFELVQVLVGHTHCAFGMCQLRDGTLVSASWDKTLKRWGIDNNDSFSNDKGVNSCISTFVGHHAWVLQVRELLDDDAIVTSHSKPR